MEANFIDTPVVDKAVSLPQLISHKSMVYVNKGQKGGYFSSLDINLVISHCMINHLIHFGHERLNTDMKYYTTQDDFR